MKMKVAIQPPVSVDFFSGSLEGEGVQFSRRAIRDMKGFFRDEEARAQLKQDTVIYEVQAICPVEQGTEGGLFYGRTTVYPGRVGDEYFMTKGHFHQKSDRAEYYWGISGSGILLCMDRDRRPYAEKISPGSLHYIPAHTAHRTVNTGNDPLVVGACWPSDAGHDYSEILQDGFPVHLEVNGGEVVLHQI